ncbi:MAG TPA: hypothetical protein VK211_08900 [Kamptonema sp.]|nr:hypothetical protein [Kamptonema sp.]
MNPSSNRSSKSRKSTPSEKEHLSEQIVNLIKAPPQPPEPTAETPVPSAPAKPTPIEPSQSTTPTDAPASTEKLQRPRQRPVPTLQVAPKEKSGDVPASFPKTPPKETLTDSPVSLWQVKPSPPVGEVDKTTADKPISVGATASEEEPTDPTAIAIRQHPIPPPSEPRQYRAVGLVRGRYAPSEDQFTRGTLIASDGTAIDAVLLGRVMSLVKNHLNLEQEHLWVVYPRTRQQDGNLHAQIMGVWEPETLKKPTDPSSDGEDTVSEENQEQDSNEESPVSFPPSHSNVENGYFSIRGEVIYQSQEEEKYVIVKIKQAPRKDGETMKFFKLKLKGDLAEKAVGYFWDFHIQLQADNLLIQQGNNIGPMPIKKKPFNKGGGGFKGKRPFTPRRDPDAPRPEPPNRKQPAIAAEAPPPRKEPLAKPIKKPKPTEG